MLLKIFSPYLEYKTQLVRLGKYNSNNLLTKYSVPQGTELGHLFF